MADYLPEPFASQLTDVAHSSFIDGFNLAAGTSAVLMFVSAVVVFLLLRRVPATTS